MLDIELVQGRPALRVEFRASLAEDLLHVLSLVLDAPWIEGLDQWVYATSTALPATLKSDMEAVLLLTQKCDTLAMWFHQLKPDDPPHRDMTAFVSWLDGFTNDDFQDLIQSTLKNLGDYCKEEGIIPLESTLENEEELRACLGQKLSGDQLERAVQLVKNPSELKALFISVISRFWEQFYHQEYQRCLPLMERSIAFHSQQKYSADLGTIFTAVTGRRPIEAVTDHEDAERAIFVPSCHIGPYVMLRGSRDPRSVVTMHYNCRPTGGPGLKEAIAIQDLFPPLKAMSDETRLQILSLLDGRELYAQEIVDLLDISQSAVSRHLKLMQSGALLKVRKENSMKYFSINEETLAGVADRLKSYRGKTSA